MTNGEWREAGFKMSWSIYDHESWETFIAMADDLEEDEAKAAHNNILLDLSAPKGMPDGIHTVRHIFGHAHGVEVRNGQFVPAPTDDAMYAAVCRSYGLDQDSIQKGIAPIDHVYIEIVEWDEEDKELLVFIGS